MNKEMEYLNTSERELVEITPEMLSRAHAVKEVASLVTQLGLMSEQAQPLVSAFRIRINQLDGVSADNIKAHLAEVLGLLSETTAADNHPCTMADRVHVFEADVEAESLPEDREPVLQKELSIDAITIDDVASSTTENYDESDNQPINTNARSLRYIQSIFGDVQSLNLREVDKARIAQTILELRGQSRTGRTPKDLTPNILMMFEGLKDREIGDEIGVAHTSVAVAFSQLVKRIKEQPGYSAASARLLLEQRLNLQQEEVVGDADNEPPFEFDGYAEPEEKAVIEKKTELRPTAMVNQLRGGVRRCLKLKGEDHTVELSDERLLELIATVFADQTHDHLVRDAYMHFLDKGLKEPGNQELANVIHQMPEKIADLLRQPSNVLSIHSSVHASRHVRPRVTPANMPQRTTLVDFTRPQHQAKQAGEVLRTTQSAEAIEEIELSPLVKAATQEEAMDQKTWYQASHELINGLPETLGWSANEAQLLWGVVHYDSRGRYAERPPEVKEVLRKLGGLVSEREAERLQAFPDMQSSIRMLVSSAFGVKTLDDIEKALHRRNPALYTQAAQRYVVAAISELVRE